MSMHLKVGLRMEFKEVTHTALAEEPGIGQRDERHDGYLVTGCTEDFLKVLAEGELGPAQSSSWPFLPRKEGWEPWRGCGHTGGMAESRQPEPPSSTLLGGVLRAWAGDATFHPSLQ